MKLNHTMIWAALGLALGYALAKRSTAQAKGAPTTSNTAGGPADFWVYPGSW